MGLRSHMVLLDNLPKQLKATDPEEKRIISGVSWEQYDAFLSQLGDIAVEVKFKTSFAPCSLLPFKQKTIS